MKLGALKAIVYSLFFLAAFSNLAFATGNVTQIVAKTVCGVISFVKAIVGILAIALFLLGGVLYAVGHFLPATGNLRGSMQNWPMGMLFAGIIAVILFIVAAPLVTMFLTMGHAVGGYNATINCSQYT